MKTDPTDPRSEEARAYEAEHEFMRTGVPSIAAELEADAALNPRRKDTKPAPEKSASPSTSSKGIPPL